MTPLPYSLQFLFFGKFGNYLQFFLEIFNNFFSNFWEFKILKIYKNQDFLVSLLTNWFIHNAFLTT